MMEERKNRVKNRTPFKEWLEGKADSEQAAYLTKNYIPVDVSYELTNFDEFFEKRKKTLRNILIDMLID